jgi:hypothetical protein
MSLIFLSADLPLGFLAACEQSRLLQCKRRPNSNPICRSCSQTASIPCPAGDRQNHGRTESYLMDHTAPPLVGLPPMMLSSFRMILSGHDSVFFHSVAALPRCDFCASTSNIQHRASNIQRPDKVTQRHNQAACQPVAWGVLACCFCIPFVFSSCFLRILFVFYTGFAPVLFAGPRSHPRDHTWPSRRFDSVGLAAIQT